ncbi:MAG: IS5 family transposase ISPaen3 [bacterium]|nr:IS5 family transposase ISPaen3 [bacterium]
MYYVLRTGIQWKALPRSLGAGSTVHRRFQKWVREGIFLNLWRWCLYNYDLMIGLDWEWQALDGAMTKAPLGCENTGPNPTDRAKQGTKRHLLTEGHGIPLAVVVTGANRNDFKETRAVLNQIVIARPEPTRRKKQHLCLDKGYDYREVDEIARAFGYTAHTRKRGEKSYASRSIPKYRSRRWVVERTHSWMNRFRRILIRWEKKTVNYEAFLHLTCAYITVRVAGVLG